MKNTLGSAKTQTKLSLEETVGNLSDAAVDILAFVLGELETSTLKGDKTDLDTRGVYVEHGKSGDKPANTKTVKELLKSGLVEAHPDSDEGVSFLSANNDVLYAAQKLGLYCAYDLIP